MRGAMRGTGNRVTNEDMCIKHASCSARIDLPPQLAVATRPNARAVRTYAAHLAAAPVVPVLLVQRSTGRSAQLCLLFVFALRVRDVSSTLLNDCVCFLQLLHILWIQLMLVLLKLRSERYQAVEFALATILPRCVNMDRTDADASRHEA